MKYYSISFSYPRPYSNFPGVSKLADDNASNAENVVEAALTKAGIKWKHSYSWPDGSLYKYVMSELSGVELEIKLRAALPNNITAHKIVSVGADHDPMKVNCSTLAEYFQAVMEPM